MSLFAIGDTHLSLGADKSMEVFPGWDNYVERLEKNWNAVVSKNDDVVIAGDVSWAMKLEDCGADFSFIHSLNGRKYLLKGNHDYWWETMKKMKEYVERGGFDSIRFLFNNAYVCGRFAVCGTRGWFFDSPEENDAKVLSRECQRLARSIEAGLETGMEPVVFLHYPPVYDGVPCSEILDVLEKYEVRRCWFGHVHGAPAGKYLRFEERGIDFGLIAADSLKFCPLLIEKY